MWYNSTTVCWLGWLGWRPAVASWFAVPVTYFIYWYTPGPLAVYEFKPDEVTCSLATRAARVVAGPGYKTWSGRAARARYIMTRLSCLYMIPVWNVHTRTCHYVPCCTPMYRDQYHIQVGSMIFITWIWYSSWFSPCQDWHPMIMTSSFWSPKTQLT
jgi:hypothetical protein